MATLVHNYSSNGDTYTDEYGTQLALNRLLDGEVIEGFKVVANSSPNMKVRVQPGSGRIPTGTYPSSYGYFVSHDTVAGEEVTIAAVAASPRLDYVLAYVDKTVAGSILPAHVNNTNGVLKFVAVAGTPAGSPNVPTSGQITAVVGSNPYIILGEILVNTGAVSITNPNIVDRRVMAKTLVPSASIKAPMIDLSTIKKTSSNLNTTLLSTTSPTKFNELVFAGDKMKISFDVTLRDGFSGAARTGDIRIYRDGVSLLPNGEFTWNTTVNGNYALSSSGGIVHNDDGNSHTYALYVVASVANATFVDNTLFTVEATA